MELNEFVNKFAEQFDITNASEIQLHTVYQDLEEWGSLTALGIIAFVKSEMDKTITGKEVRGCDTVEDLYNLIQSK